MSTATDAQIMGWAARDQRVVVSADTDFGELLAVTNQSRPSVVLLRRQGNRRASEVADLLMLNLPAVEEDLNRGAIVVLDADRIRVRALPFYPDCPSFVWCFTT